MSQQNSNTSDDEHDPGKKQGGRKPTGQLIWRKSGWYGRYMATVDGERIRVSRALGTTNKVVAKRKLARLVASGEASASVVERSETYSEAAERIRTQREAEGYRDVYNERIRDRQYLCPMLGDVPVTDIGKEHIRAVIDDAVTTGRSRETLAHIRSAASIVFRVLEEEGGIPDGTNPAKDIRIPKMAKRDPRERAVVSDAELALYLAWDPPEGTFRVSAIERQVMASVCRMFGGLRTGDLHALRWEAFDSAEGTFTVGWAPRQKTRRPQLLEVPETLRPILRRWWDLTGRPAAGLMFPARKAGKRGDRAGQERLNVSHAKAFRRDLQRAFTWAHERGVAGVPTPASPRWRELFEEGEFTRPVDFHSWRRAYTQALAEAGLNAQQATALAGHASLDAHARYLRNSGRMRSLPDSAVPKLGLGSVSAQIPTPPTPTTNAKSPGNPMVSRALLSGADETRTRDLRRDRPLVEISPSRNPLESLPPDAGRGSVIAPDTGAMPKGSALSPATTPIPAGPTGPADMIEAADAAIVTGDIHAARRWLAELRRLLRAEGVATEDVCDG